MAREEPQMVAELLLSDQNRWNEGLLHRFFDEDIIKDILSIPVRPTYTEDKLIWTENSNNQLTVKSAYDTIKQADIHYQDSRPSSSFQLPSIIWKKIWKLQLPPKIRFFLWSISQNALPSKANLFHRHISADPICGVCANQTPETLEHIFLLCPWTSIVWSHPWVRIHILPTQINRIEAWLADRFADNQNSPGMEVVVVILWQV